MESLVNFENLKELIYYYAISDRNGISILNKNLEKENYTKLIQETCVELFKRDYNIGLISNKQGEYCDSYPEKIVILESEKQEDEKEDNKIVKIEDIRERIFKGKNRIGEKKKRKEKVKQERNNNDNKEEGNVKLSIKTVKRKNNRTEEEEEEENDIITSGFFSPKKTQKNSFWEERRNSITKSSVTNLSLPNTCYFQPPPSLPLLSPQSHPNNKYVTWNSDTAPTNEEITKEKKNKQKIEEGKNNNGNDSNSIKDKNIKNNNNNNNNILLDEYGNNLNFDNISYDGVNVDDNNSYSFVSYGNLSSPKNGEQGLTTHLNSPNTFIKPNSAKEQEGGGLEPKLMMQKDFNSTIPSSKKRFSNTNDRHHFTTMVSPIVPNFNVDDEDYTKLKNAMVSGNSFSQIDPESSNPNKNKYLTSYSDEIPFVMDDISMEYFTSDAIDEAEQSKPTLRIESYSSQYNQFNPTMTDKSNTTFDSILNENDESTKDPDSISIRIPNTHSSSFSNSMNPSSSQPIDVKLSTSADYDFSDWSLTQIKSSLSNLTLQNYQHNDSGFIPTMVTNTSISNTSNKRFRRPSKPEFFKPTVKLNENFLLNPSESSIKDILESKPLKALLDYNLYTPTMDTYNKESFSSNDSFNSYNTDNENRNNNMIDNENNICNANANNKNNVMEDIQNALFDNLSNSPTTHSKKDKIHSESSKAPMEDQQQQKYHNVEENELEGQKMVSSSINRKKKINDTEALKKLFMKSNLSRVRSRFVIPVILYKNKNICRSGTLSLEPEMLLNSLNSKTKEIIYGISSDNPSAETTLRESINKCRHYDIELIKKLNIHYISDLMVETKKIKYGLTVSSSEKCEPRGQYEQSGVHLIVVPYPGSEYFKNFKLNHYCARNLKVDWTSSIINSELNFPLYDKNYLNINWNQYKSWDFVQLTQNYLKLFVNLLQQKSSNLGLDTGLLVHCISGWDRTPLFISLLRLSLWADGEIHTSLNPEEILYLTIGYDWFSFCHLLSDRMTRGEVVFDFCFYFLHFILSHDFSASYLSNFQMDIDNKEPPESETFHTMDEEEDHNIENNDTRNQSLISKLPNFNISKTFKSPFSLLSVATSQNNEKDETTSSLHPSSSSLSNHQSYSNNNIVGTSSDNNNDDNNNNIIVNDDDNLNNDNIIKNNDNESNNNDNNSNSNNNKYNNNNWTYIPSPLNPSPSPIPFKNENDRFSFKSPDNNSYVPVSTSFLLNDLEEGIKIPKKRNDDHSIYSISNTNSNIGDFSFIDNFSVKSTNSNKFSDPHGGHVSFSNSQNKNSSSNNNPSKSLANYPLNTDLDNIKDFAIISPHVLKPDLAINPLDLSNKTLCDKDTTLSTSKALVDGEKITGRPRSRSRSLSKSRSRSRSISKSGSKSRSRSRSRSFSKDTRNDYSLYRIKNGSETLHDKDSNTNKDLIFSMSFDSSKSHRNSLPSPLNIETLPISDPNEPPNNSLTNSLIFSLDMNTAAPDTRDPPSSFNNDITTTKYSSLPSHALYSPNHQLSRSVDSFHSYHFPSPHPHRNHMYSPSPTYERKRSMINSIIFEEDNNNNNNNDKNNVKDDDSNNSSSNHNYNNNNNSSKNNNNAMNTDDYQNNNNPSLLQSSSPYSSHPFSPNSSTLPPHHTIPEISTSVPITFHLTTQNSPSYGYSSSNTSSSSNSTFSNSYNQYRIRRNSQTNLDILRFRNHMSYNSGLADRNYRNPTTHYSLKSYYEGRKLSNPYPSTNLGPSKPIQSAKSPSSYQSPNIFKKSSFSSTPSSSSNDGDDGSEKLNYNKNTNSHHTSIKTTTIPKEKTSVNSKSPLYHKLKKYKIKHYNSLHNRSIINKKEPESPKIKLYPSLVIKKSSLHYSKIKKRYLKFNNNNKSMLPKKYFHTTVVETPMNQRLLKTFRDKYKSMKKDNDVEPLDKTQSFKDSTDIKKFIDNNDDHHHPIIEKEELDLKFQTNSGTQPQSIPLKKSFEMIPGTVNSSKKSFEIIPITKSTTTKNSVQLWTCPCCSDALMTEEKRKEARYYYRKIYGLTKEMDDHHLPSYLQKYFPCVHQPKNHPLDHDNVDHSNESIPDNLVEEKQKLREYRLRAVRHLFLEARIWALTQQNVNKISQKETRWIHGIFNYKRN